MGRSADDRPSEGHQQVWLPSAGHSLGLGESGSTIKCVCRTFVFVWPSRSLTTSIQREHLKVAAEQAVLVCVQPTGRRDTNEDPFREITALTETAGAAIVGTLIQKMNKPRASTYLGKGKVEELRLLCEQVGATLVIFDNDLTPAQVRGLELVIERKIIDRSELILDIFANRATTHAAKLQVEMAQLEYTYPRLRAMWDHLGQVVGGAPIGIGTRGPGEKQIEIDRRLVQRRLKRLRDELAEIEQRKVRQVANRNIDHFTVGLVGYTNAGKSTLFNRLTAGGGAFADRKLFATLSTRIEKWDLGGGNDVLLSDTVGFIRDLPHHLVASFRSTLEETVYAQVLLVVVDVADSSAAPQLATVNDTLDEIGATTQPRLLVLNKVDQLDRSRDLLPWLNRYPDAVTISAATGEGVELLTDRVREFMLGPIAEVEIISPLSDSRTLTFLEQRTDVLSRAYDNGDAHLRVRIGRRQVQQLLARGASISINGQPPQEGLKKQWNIDDTEVASLEPPHERHWYT